MKKSNRSSLGLTLFYMFIIITIPLVDTVFIDGEVDKSNKRLSSVELYIRSANATFSPYVIDYDIVRRYVKSGSSKKTKKTPYYYRIIDKRKRLEEYNEFLKNLPQGDTAEVFEYRSLYILVDINYTDGERESLYIFNVSNDLFYYDLRRISDSDSKDDLLKIISKDIQACRFKREVRR